MANNVHLFKEGGKDMISFGYDAPPSTAEPISLHTPMSGRLLPKGKKQQHPQKKHSTKRAFPEPTKRHKNHSKKNSNYKKQHKAEPFHESTAKAINNAPPMAQFPDSPNDSLAAQIRETSETTKIRFAKAHIAPTVVPLQLSLFSKSTALPRINLVLDLDLTIIQAFVVQNELVMMGLRQDPRVQFFPYGAMQMALVLRPHVKYFLHSLSEFADIYVYTHGEKMYAEAIMSKFVDPDKRYIKRNRLFASERGDNGFNIIKRKKALDHIFTDKAQKSRAVIFDDQTTVWEACDQNYAISSMKFAPLPQFDLSIKEPHRYYFSCFEDEQMQRFTDEQMPHIEGFASTRSQLKYIAAFLRTCYIEYILCREAVFATVVQRKLRQVLASCVVSGEHFFNSYGKEVKAEEEVVRGQYLTLAEKLGAKVVVKGNATHYLFFNKKVNVVPLVSAGAYNVHVYFVMHSYFNCVKMPEEEFKVLSTRIT